jgi:uncharacterized protein YbaP (TraB family)
MRLGARRPARASIRVRRRGWVWFAVVALGCCAYGCTAPTPALVATPNPTGSSAPQVSSAFALEPQPLLWRAIPRSGDGEVHLFGSIHFGREPVSSLDASVELAYAAADVLAVEINVAAIDPARLAQVFSSMGRLGDGVVLADRLPSETYARLRDALVRLSLPAAAFDGFEPWFVYMTLTDAILRAEGYLPEYGVDPYFIARATAERKPIEALETLEYQLGLLAGFDDALQVLLLEQTLDMQPDAALEMDEMMSAWRDGDADALDRVFTREFTQDERLAPVYRKLILDRNRAMAQWIDSRVSSGEDLFVVVGAGHLVGAQGIPELMRALGYRVERVSAGTR